MFISLSTLLRNSYVSWLNFPPRTRYAISRHTGISLPTGRGGNICRPGNPETNRVDSSRTIEEDYHRNSFPITRTPGRLGLRVDSRSRRIRSYTEPSIVKGVTLPPKTSGSVLKNSTLDSQEGKGSSRVESWREVERKISGTYDPR